MDVPKSLCPQKATFPKASSPLGEDFSFMPFTFEGKVMGSTASCQSLSLWVYWAFIEFQVINVVLAGGRLPPVNGLEDRSTQHYPDSQ
jgi:hypothetical protein